MNYVPLSDKVVVRPLKEKQTEGGIVIPDTDNTKPQQGIVLSAGPGRVTPDGTLIPMDPKIKPGRHVLFPGYAGDEIELGRETITILRQQDISCVEDDDDDDAGDGDAPSVG